MALIIGANVAGLTALWLTIRHERKHSTWPRLRPCGPGVLLLGHAEDCACRVDPNVHSRAVADMYANELHE